MPITLLYGLWKTGWGVNDCFTASGWTPEGRRTRGRPKSTWRRRKSWAVVKAFAQNRKCWSGSSIKALCANWRDDRDMMMTRHDDSRWWCAMELNVSEEITCNRQNHSFLSNKYTSQALYQTLQTTKWTYWKAARQYNLKFAKNTTAIRFQSSSSLVSGCAQICICCVICIPPFHVLSSSFYVLYSLLWQFSTVSIW